jgi:REP element-mobilizing transposase RayT
VEVAEIVENALLHFDGQRYNMLSWCVMPNHVHAVVEPVVGHPFGPIIHSWKSFTAHRSNRVLRRTGRFWMPDYFDRYIRDENHLGAAISYVEENPVKAGLCERVEEWRWSSAYRR